MAERARSQELWDETPPHNLAMERELLGCLIVCGVDRRYAAAIGETFAYLTSGDFYGEAYGKLFASLARAWKRQVPFTTGCLVQWFRDDAQDVEAVDIAEATQQAGFPWNLGHYRTTLRRLTAERTVRTIAWELAALAHHKPPGEWCRTALERIGRLRDRIKKSGLP